MPDVQHLPETPANFWGDTLHAERNASLPCSRSYPVLAINPDKTFPRVRGSVILLVFQGRDTEGTMVVPL